MRHVTLALAGTALAFTAAPASAQADAGCEFYASMGETMVEFFLPLTLQELVNMVSGKDPALEAKMTGELLEGMSAEQLAYLVAADEEEAGLIGEAAGSAAMELLMSGRATSATEAKAVMRETCNAIGSDKVIANMRQIRSIEQSSIGG